MCGENKPMQGFHIIMTTTNKWGNPALDEFSVSIRTLPIDWCDLGSKISQTSKNVSERGLPVLAGLCSGTNN